MADNKQMIKNLFADMQDALFLGDRFASGEFVSFLQPGQFVSLNLQENDGSHDMAIQAEITDVLIDSSYINKYKDINFSSGTELIGKVSQVYEDILYKSALPHKDLSEATTTEINNIVTWLTQNDANYTKYEGDYDTAVNAFQTEKSSQNPRPDIISMLDRKIDEAKFRWESIGNRNLHDLKKGRLIYLTQEDPQTFWSKLKDQMEKQKKTTVSHEEYYQTFLTPAISAWNSGGWPTFIQAIGENETHDYSKNTAWSGGISVGWGLWSVGGGASGSTSYSRTESKASTVNLKFEYLRVKIYRPWMSQDIFNYNFWTWNKQFGGTWVSDGGNLQLNQPVRPIGRMPILPEYLIVVKNLELSANFTQEEKDYYNQQIQTNASVGWGPFSLSGSYREETTTKNIKASFDGVTFKVDNPQIIARTGPILHKCPNPNKHLDWNLEEACFPDNDCFSNALTNIPTNSPIAIQELRRLDNAEMFKAEKMLELKMEAEKMKANWLSEKISAFK